MVRFVLFFILLLTAVAFAGDWPQFRGPEGAGIAEGAGLPMRFGEDTNLQWKTNLPPGHSSPVIAGGRIFLTAYEDETLLVMALQQRTGEVLWRREAPRPRREPHQSTHGPASPSPVTDGENVYVFFGDFGVLSYDAQGNERWRYAMGPFDNINGHGSSPILADDKLLVLCDQAFGSYLVALDTATGKTIWKADRSDITRSYATPGIFYPTGGRPQVVAPGAYRVVSYDLQTGEKLWWVDGFAWQLKCVPLFAGNTIYINAWETGGDPGQQKETPTFKEVIAEHDQDKDGKLSREEVPDEGSKRDRFWLEHDLDADGLMGERDWYFYQARRAPVNNLVAIRPDGRRGDITREGVLWRYNKSLPNTPSPLLYRDMIYLVRDGGIFSSIDPASGGAHSVTRLRDAIDKYWASPVAGDGKIYTVSEGCTISTIAPGGDWKVLETSTLDGTCFATPAIVGGHMYIRTLQAMYSFTKQ